MPAIYISSNKSKDDYDPGEIKKVSKYNCVKTNNEGIYKIVDDKGGYMVSLDYGRETCFDEKTGKYKIKQRKTVKRVDTEKEAKKLRKEAEEIREGRRSLSSAGGANPKKYTVDDVIKDYKRSTRFQDMSDSYKDHFYNYLNHISSVFGQREPSAITIPDIEDYFSYKMEKGCLIPGVGGKKTMGLSINTMCKHKSALKKLWQFMMDSKVYGVDENIVEKAKIPKKTINIDGVMTQVSREEYHAVSLSIEELNYILNDALQHEYDRSVALMIGLAAIGGLRRSEVGALTIGNMRHDDMMDISYERLERFGFDRE